jgi:hypothetical protein
MHAIMPPIHTLQRIVIVLMAVAAIVHVVVAMTR